MKLGSIETIKAPLSVFYVNSSNFSGDIYRLNDNLKKLVNDEITKNYVASSKLLRKHLSRIDYYKGRALQKIGDPKATKILWGSFIRFPIL